MAKGKVKTNITQNEYVYIDGSTGEELSQKEFIQRYSSTNPIRHRVDVSTVSSEEIEGEDK